MMCAARTARPSASSKQEPLFYLKSRGIPQAEAEKIVVEGFFDPIFQRIPFEGVRERFQQYIADKMA
jgi:Fe-S cluster assembly protein SufD